MGQVQPTFMKIVEILMRGLHCTLDGVVMQKVGRAPSRSPSLVDNYPLIQKKQISIPMFCCSPLKNDSLQKHIKASHLEELYLPWLQSAWLAGIPCCKCWYDSYFWKTELKKYYLIIASFGKILINEDENEGDVEMLIDLVDALNRWIFALWTFLWMTFFYLMPTKWNLLFQNSRTISPLLQKECMSNFLKGLTNAPALRNSSSVVAKQWFLIGLSKA